MPDKLAGELLVSEAKKQEAILAHGSQEKLQSALLRGFMAAHEVGAGCDVKFSPDFKLVLVFAPGDDGDAS